MFILMIKVVFYISKKFIWCVNKLGQKLNQIFIMKKNFLHFKSIVSNGSWKLQLNLHDPIKPNWWKRKVLFYDVMTLIIALQMKVTSEDPSSLVKRHFLQGRLLETFEETNFKAISFAGRNNVFFSFFFFYLFFSFYFIFVSDPKDNKTPLSCNCYRKKSALVYYSFW